VCFMAENGQHFPWIWREPAKNSKLLLAGNAAKHTEKLNFFMFFNKIFLHKNSRKYDLYIDLSKSVSQPKTECR
jgi:hypothetical protein